MQSGCTHQYTRTHRAYTQVQHARQRRRRRSRMHTHNREIYLDQGNKLLTQTFCVYNAHIILVMLSELRYQRQWRRRRQRQQRRQRTFWIRGICCIIMREWYLLSAQLNRSLVHSLTCLVHSFNFFVSLHWPILLLLVSFLSSLHRTMPRHKHIYIMNAKISVYCVCV